MNLFEEKAQVEPYFSIQTQAIPSTLKGNKRIAPTNLKTSEMVRPTIVNGRRISHINGSRKINTSARGQHRASKMNQSRIANKVFIYQLISTSQLTNAPPILKPHNFWLVQHCQFVCPFISVQFADQKCTVEMYPKKFFFVHNRHEITLFYLCIMLKQIGTYRIHNLRSDCMVYLPRIFS